MKKLLLVNSCLFLLFPSVPAHASGMDAASEGYRLATQRQNAEAILQFRKALELGDLTQEQEAKTYYNLGTTVLNQGDPGRALKSFEKAEKLDPKNAALLLNKSEALRLLGRYDDALKAVEASCEQEDSAGCYYQKGLILIALNNAKDAVAVLEKAVSKDRRNTDYLLSYGQALTVTGEYKKAEKTLTRALKENAWIGEAYVYRSAAWRGLGEEQKARADLMTAVKVAPYNPFVRSAYRSARLSNQERNVKEVRSNMSGKAAPSKSAKDYFPLIKGQLVDVLKCREGWCAVESIGSFAGYVPEKKLK